jgi:hypothetical protein
MSDEEFVAHQLQKLKRAELWWRFQIVAFVALFIVLNGALAWLMFGV